MCSIPGVGGGVKPASVIAQEKRERLLSVEEQAQRAAIRIPVPAEAMLADRPQERVTRASLRIPKGTIEVSRIRG